MISELFNALRAEDEPAIEASLANVVNVNAFNDDGLTPLMVAADGILGDVVAKLIGRGASVNLVDRDGNTALMRLAGRWRDDVHSGDRYRVMTTLCYLINAPDSELEKRNGMGEDVIDLLGVSHSVEVGLYAESSFKHLAHGALLRSRRLLPEAEQRIYMAALEADDASLIMECEEFGVPRPSVSVAQAEACLANGVFRPANAFLDDWSDTHGFAALDTLLQAASELGDYANDGYIGYYWKNSDASDAVDDPFDYVQELYSDHVDMLVRLLDLGASPFVPDGEARTAYERMTVDPPEYWSDYFDYEGVTDRLRSASQRSRDLEVLRGLPQLGLEAVLHAAERVSDTHLISALATIRTEGGETAFDDAEANERLRNTDPYHRLVAEPVTTAAQSLLAAAKSGTVADVQGAIAAGVDVNARTERGWTALMWAASFNVNPAVVTALVAAGADVNARDKDGKTAIMVAARYSENPEVVIALLDAGADAKLRDIDGKTAFDYIKDNEALRNTDADQRLSNADF